MTRNEGDPGENRFARSWREWDAQLEKGKRPKDLLSDLPSETIMQLLAGAGNERRYERDILATEAMNRLAQARRRIERTTDEVAALVRDVKEQGEKTRHDVHATEEVVARLQGAENLGVDSPQEITAHSASDLVENLMSVVDRAVAALQRLEEVRESDQKRELGRESDEGSGRS